MQRSDTIVYTHLLPTHRSPQKCPKELANLSMRQYEHEYNAFELIHNTYLIKITDQVTTSFHQQNEPNRRLNKNLNSF